MIEAHFWVTFLLLYGAMFIAAYVLSRPRDAPGAMISRGIIQLTGPLVLAWLVARELMSF